MKIVKKAASRVNRMVWNCYHVVRPRVGNLYYNFKMNRLLRQADAETTPNRLFRGISDGFWYWLITLGYKRSPELRGILPGFPDEKTQLNIAASSGEVTLRQAFFVYRLFKQVYEKHAGRLSSCERVLDFGCGWGRIIRFFLKDLDPSKLFGVDCTGKMIEICNQTNKWCSFLQFGPWPPTTFPPNSFDLIYSFSVFSHLAEEMHSKWLEEFQRILRPGGILIATTRNRNFIEQCAALRGKKELPFYLAPLQKLFPDTEQSLADFDNGAYCYNAIDNKWWGETCIPKGYVLKHWTKHFHFLDYIDDPKRCEQNVIVVRK